MDSDSAASFRPRRWRMTGVLIWDEPPPSPGPNVSVIPYALGGISRDYEANTPLSTRQDIGMDGKVAIGSALNLDLTVNPDFSQVDVDQQVTNLGRYELFFPEKRQFFLENGDQFTNFGYATIRPFFSRRIGLDGVPIRFGARLSGKLNKDWRLGVMDMQTGAADDGGLPPQNFAVFALQRRVFSRSNIGVLLVDKESPGYRPAGAIGTPSGYNRNLGSSTTWRRRITCGPAKLLYLRSFTSGNRGRGTSIRATSVQQPPLADQRADGERGSELHRRSGLRAAERLSSRAGDDRLHVPAGGRPRVEPWPALNSSNFFDWTGRLSDYETTLELRGDAAESERFHIDRRRGLRPAAAALRPDQFGPRETGSRQRASLEVLEDEIRLQAAERVAVWLLVPVRRLLCRRHTAGRDRHDRVPVSALRQPGRRGDVQRYPASQPWGHTRSGWSARDSTSR